jgi:hypothetical protein
MGFRAYPWFPIIEFNFIIPDILEYLLCTVETILDGSLQSMESGMDKGIHDLGEDGSLHF